MTDPAKDYENQPHVRAAMDLVSAHLELTRTGGWASFKARLWAILEPGKPYPGTAWTVPQEYIYASKRLQAGWNRRDAYRQVVSQWRKS